MPAGTVYCTCAQALPPLMQTAGGKLPEPVSSYTTSTPAGSKTRMAVMPEHDAAGYRSGHMLTVKVWPAEAVTPQLAELSVSVLVLATVKAPHSATVVGARVGTALGAALGVVGLAVGMADGSAGGTVGPGVGIADGTGLGLKVVGDMVGIEEGSALGATVGAAVGRKMTPTTPAPVMADWPEQAKLALQPSWMT